MPHSFIHYLRYLGRFSPFLYATQALRVSRGIALLFSRTFGTRCGWGCQPHAPAASTPRKDLVPIVQEAGWAPGPVWTGTENLAPTGFRSPACLAHSQLLYRLSYPACGRHFDHIKVPMLRSFHGSSIGSLTVSQARMTTYTAKDNGLSCLMQVLHLVQDPRYSRSTVCTKGTWTAVQR